MNLFLTVDAGGTSTRALVHTGSGDCLGYAVGTGGNPIASGVEAVAAAMKSTATQALRHAAVRPDQVGHALAAMAGSAVGLGGVDVGLRELGIGPGLQLGSDLEATFFSGTAELTGVALVAGTGAAAIVVRDGATVARSDGRGWLLGDVGSGYWIGRRVVRAVTADLDRRGPRTALTERLLTATGVSDGRSAGKDDLLDGLVTTIYAIRTPGIARFAPLAFDVSQTDEVAARIVADAATGLAGSVAALDSTDREKPLVLGGSVLYHQPALRERVIALIREGGWSGPIDPVADGMLGAVSMNLRSAGIAVDSRLHERTSASLNKIREPHN